MNGWRTIPLSKTLGIHAKDWDQLLKRKYRANPMLDSRFIEGLLKYFGCGDELLCILEVKGQVQAMCIVQRQSTGVWTTFLPSQAQIGPTLLDQPPQIRHLIKALPGLVGQLNFLCNDPDFGNLTVGQTSFSTSKHHALTMSTELNGSYQQYWATRSKSLVNNIARYERRAAADNVALKFVHICDPAEVRAAVARYADLESKGWKGKLGTAISLNTSQGDFYDELIHTFSQSGEASVYELWLDGKLAAARLAIISGNTIVMLKTAYDEALGQYAPGRLLLREVIRNSFETHSGGTIEYYTNANVNQLAWATSHRWIVHVSHFRGAGSAVTASILRSLRRAYATVPNASNSTIISLQENIKVYSKPSQLPADVQRLFYSSEREIFEPGTTWYQTLLDTLYLNHERIRFYVLQHNGHAVACIPVLVNIKGQHKYLESLSNYGTAIYSPAIAVELTPKDLVPLIENLREDNLPLTSLNLASMNPSSSAYAKLLEAFALAGMKPFQYFCFGNYYLQVKNNWADYLKGRSSSLQSTIKRMGEKFIASGGTLQLIQSPQDLERCQQAYSEVYAASWQGAEPHVNFIPGLMRAYAEKGWLRLGIAWLGNKPIATQIWIVANGKANIYKLAHHEDHTAYAPNTLLTAMLMQHVMDIDGVREVDDLTGDDPSKKIWMSDRRERWGLMVYNPRSPRAWLGIAREIVGRMFQHVRSKFKGTPADEV